MTRHRMPFGAEVLKEGGVRFRLWAPSAGRVELTLLDPPDRTERLPMQAQADGWLETVTKKAGPGTRYRYRIDNRQEVPDPASRYQPEGVHAASQVVDAASHAWGETAWRGRVWEEAVVYELHIGAFTEEGTYAAAARRFEYLVELGVTAIEIMPLAAFPGRRNWGYDGVLPFAPYEGYGTPDDLRALVDAAHAHGLMVLLDVVYNHFGPEGNYLHLYARDFFSDRYRTPWGDAINFDGVNSRPVRDFFIHNALYWLEEFRMDGLRLDAVHAIRDSSQPDILEELADTVRNGPGQQREIHLVLENVANEGRHLTRSANGAPQRYTAQWNDDYHHACHVLLTGETDGYYVDYQPDAVSHLGRCLAEGFAYQGEVSAFRGEPRGESSAGLPYGAFISFLQNHDQIGNRAFGERLADLAPAPALRAAVSITLLAPSVPGLFMGEEFGCTQPFLFFADFEGELADAVREGRRQEFAGFARFADESQREHIPDPNAEDTFDRSRLKWSALDDEAHRDWLDLYRRLLAMRKSELAPRLAGTVGEEYRTDGGGLIRAAWRLGDGSRLTLVANMSETGRPGDEGPEPGELLHREPERSLEVPDGDALEPWSVRWFLDRTARAGR